MEQGRVQYQQQVQTWFRFAQASSGCLIASALDPQDYITKVGAHWVIPVALRHDAVFRASGQVAPVPAGWMQ